MNSSELETCFKLMGSKMVSRGLNRSAHCPLAPWTHTGGRDKKPSLMAIAKDPAEFICFSCKEKGWVRTLAKKYAQYCGDCRAFDYVVQCEGGLTGAWGRLARKSKAPREKILDKKFKPKPITEDQLKIYLEEVPHYAWERGLTKAQVLKWEIGYDAYKKRMMFPIRDIHGKLVGVSGRALVMNPDEDSKYKHSYGFRKEHYLYGESFWDVTYRRAFIVEGFFDVHGMERHGFKNVFATMGTSMSDEQILKFKDRVDEIVFFPDANDEGQGLQFAEESCLELLAKLKTVSVRVAGVRGNPFYIKRDPPGRWDKSDHRLEVLENFVGKDPAEWDENDIRIGLDNLATFKFVHGGVDVDFHKVDLGWSARSVPKTVVVERDLLSEIFS